MAEQKNFTNVLLSDRSKLPPKDSIQKLIDYAIIQDNRSRARRFHHVKANWVISILVFTIPAYYLLKGSFDGCWTNLHPETKFYYSFGSMGRSIRSMYRPEIYYRDRQAFFYDLELENIKKEKAGEKPTTNSALVLWT